MKGGAAGGGYAQVVPMEDINLHFTGDFHAIGAANNLLAAMVDNHIYWGNELGIDPRRVTWRRGLDMNDRALRQIISSLGGVANGFPREDGFDIIVASEVMAIFCLATDLNDLKRRLGQHHRRPDPGARAGARRRAEGRRRDGGAAEGRARAQPGADAGEQPGLHPWRPVRQHRAWLQLGDRDQDGAEARRLRRHRGRVRGRSRRREILRHQVPQGRAQARRGGRRRHRARAQDAWRRRRATSSAPRTSRRSKPGFANLARHLENLRGFGVPAVVSVNRFSADTEAEHAKLKELCAAHGVEAVIADHWAYGGEGAAPLAEAVVKTIDKGQAKFQVLYPDEMPLRDKIKTIAQKIYRAKDIACDGAVETRLAELQKGGFGHFPVCIAKTQYSFTTDANAKGAPSDHILPVREIRLSAGAEFIVAVCGEIMTMPGLPRVPAANSIDLTEDGRITGLF